MVDSHLAVVGGGVIGLSAAWTAARDGWRVTVLDPAPCSGASWVAGGMLAPVTETWPGEESLLDLGTESVRRWPEFAARLSADAGTDAGLQSVGTVVAATGSGDRAELDTLAEHLGRLGRPVERLSGRELRRLEPSIGPDVRGGLSVPDDLSVDNRMLLDALRAAVAATGVRIDERAVTSVRDDGARVLGVVTADAGEVDADAVLIAAGAHASSLHPALDGLIRPVKGEILRLTRRPGSLPPPERTVRALVDGKPVYAVPRVAPGHGDLVVGATTSENGFDTTVTVGGVRDLLRDVERVLPGVAEYALTESAAGLRPGSRDNLPVIGNLGPDGLFAATGHGRNGMLLVPLTADAIGALLRGDTLPEAVRPASASRFDPAAVGGGAQT